MQIVQTIITAFVSLVLVSSAPAQIRDKLPATNQKEPPRYRAFVNKFIEQLNREDYKKVAASLSGTYLNSVPEEEHISFLKDFRKYGPIRRMKFKYFDLKGSAVYLTEFGKLWMNVIFTIDEKNMIKRFVITDPNFNEDLPLKTNKTPLRLPFDSTWYVFWGGLTEDQNYHVGSRAQKNAFDLVIRDPGNKSFKSDGKSNADYYAFGIKIVSPCAATVVKVVDGVPDNLPGEMNPEQLTGNTIILKTRNNEYILLAHFKENSIRVKKNDRVKAGQHLGDCGNSGNSSEPHLHIHMMDTPELKTGTGTRMNFQKLKVNGQLKMNYSPVKGERIAVVN